MNRVTRHLLFLLMNIAALGLAVLLLPYAEFWERISVGSAWFCLLLLCGVLLIGPMLRLARQPAPQNIYLRRDLAFWSASQGFLHFYAGNVVSMNQIYIQSFVRIDEQPFPLELRDQFFTWGASLGLVVGVLFLVLLAISSDRALRRIGLGRWKKIQKIAHAVLWLTVIHGVAFQLLEERYLPLALMSAITLGVIVLQYQGRRKKQSDA